MSAMLAKAPSPGGPERAPSYDAEPRCQQMFIQQLSGCAHVA